MLSLLQIEALSKLDRRGAYRALVDKNRIVNKPAWITEGAG
jgi:hypothetical protein